MNPTILANIAIKVISVYLMAQGIMQMPSIVTLFQYSSSQIEQNNQMLIIIIAAIVTPLIVGLVLWAISNKLSKIITKRLPDVEQEPITIANIQVAAISTIGLVLLVLTIPQLVSLVMQLFGNMNTVDGDKVFNIDSLSYVLAAVVKIVLGLALVLGASGWVRLLHKVRRLGLK